MTSPAVSHAKPSPVINFAAVAKKPGARVAKLPDHPDAELIQACVEFGVAIQGISGAFEADPTGDKDFAHKMDVALLRRAETKEARIVGLYPTTLDGLRAKAVAANLALTSDPENFSKLLSSLCADVVKFHRASKNTSAAIQP